MEAGRRCKGMVAAVCGFPDDERAIKFYADGHANVSSTNIYLVSMLNQWMMRREASAWTPQPQTGADD